MTRMVSGYRHTPYKNRLAQLGLIILEQRQLRGDLIKVFKIICGFENVNFCGLAKICRDAGTVDA